MDEGTKNKVVGPALLLSNGFERLVTDAMLLRRVSIAELSRKTGVSRSKLSRGLKCQSQFEPSVIKRLFAALDIDMPRAVLAICRFDDWRRYYDQDVEIISGLIDHLPEQLAVAREGCERSAISQGGLRTLAERISGAVAKNDRLVVSQRESFMFGDDLQLSRARG